jgi:ABC-2 type transport system ATP-binding protein
VSDAPIRLQELQKHYKKKVVLDGANLDIPAGSVTGLLGKNGEGKTTLIKCALGLIAPTGGRAELLGENSWRMSAETKARIGYVPQIVQLYPWLTVRQAIDYFAVFYPKWNERLVGELVREFNVDPKQKIAALSLGTLQKVAIILALAHEPELLILDEPAASLDPAARRDFLKALVNIAADGKRTILFSTHITSDLERVADRVAILRGGKIVYDGELADLKEQVKRLRITARAPIAPGFTIPGGFRSRIEGNEALVSVRDASPELLSNIESQLEARVRVEDLNLEDIFLEMHQ